MVRTRTKHLVGIDEAGRGPLAGPLSVGVFAITPAFDRKRFRGIRDSKKLSAASREAWLAKMEEWAEEGTARFAVGFASASEIDRKGLTWAIRKAMASALLKLGHEPASCEVLLDGSLKAPAEYARQKTIVKGDEKEPVISCASIAAKVSRDRLLAKLDRKHPGYGFGVHKGYGTSAHYRSIKTLGLSPVHRRSFLKSVLQGKK
jgi:ribonuclease HII